MSKLVLKYVNDENLRIARENIGYSIDDVAKKISPKNLEKEKNKIKNFEEGKAIPTFSQLKKLAQEYNISYFLLLSKNKIKKRSEKESPKDFRKIEDKDNPVLKKMIAEMLIKQKNIERILRDDNVKLGFISEKSKKIDVPLDMARLIINKLDLNMEEFRKQRDYDSALKYLVDKFKTYSHQVQQNRNGRLSGISVEDMRGLSLYNEHAPFIILHRQDGPTAKIFTLLHELTHIFRKNSVISNIKESVLDFRDGKYDKEEYFCNKVASEILLSDISFEYFDSTDTIRSYAKELKVSGKTLFIKLKQLNKNNGDVETIEEEINFKIEYLNKNKKSGGNYNNSTKDSNSSLYSNIIHNAYLTEKIGPVETYNLLGMNPEKL